MVLNIEEAILHEHSHCLGAFIPRVWHRFLVGGIINRYSGARCTYQGAVARSAQGPGAPGIEVAERFGPSGRRRHGHRWHHRRGNRTGVHVPDLAARKAHAGGNSNRAGFSDLLAHTGISRRRSGLETERVHDAAWRSFTGFSGYFDHGYDQTVLSLNWEYSGA